MTPYDFGSIALLLSFILATEWMISYHVMTGGTWTHLGRWARSVWGRHMMSLAGSISVVTGLYLIAIVIIRVLEMNEPNWLTWFRNIALFLVPITLLRRRIILQRYQGRRARERYATARHRSDQEEDLYDEGNDEL